MAEEKKSFVSPYLRASYPIIYVNTSECARAQDSIIQEAIESSKKKSYQFYSWDCEAGTVQFLQNKTGSFEKKPIAKIGGMDPLDPLTPLRFLKDKNDPQIMFLHNYHKWINGIDVQQFLLNNLDMLKSNGKCVVILSPVNLIPKEIEKYVVCLDFGLPGPEEIRETVDMQIKGLSTKAETLTSIKKNVEDNWEQILNASKGLSKFELENSVAMSLIEKRIVCPTLIGGMKRQLVKKSETLEFINFKERFSDIGGLDRLKKFALKIVKSHLAKGILMTGVPGCGKSMIAKALGNEANLPVISMDFGRMFGKLVGESEGKMRDALAIIDAVSPAVILIDEIEKGLGGIKSSNMSDGGTGSRVFGTFLNWLQDKKTGSSYCFATSNKIDAIPPEFLRAGRWDAIFFVDLPNSAERKTILEMYIKKFGINPNNVPDLKGWSGAEIEQVCRIARIFQDAGDENCDLGAASEFVIPLSRTRGDEITKIRDWAKNNANPASTRTEDDEKATAESESKGKRMLDVDENGVRSVGF
jgi:hypothetical protein